jgi:hypothetical protein
VANANNELLSAGATVLASESAAIVERKLGVLESVSRLIEARMERSAFGSGFGPRTGTNRYDGCGRNYLRLVDDLLTVTSITILASTGAASSTVLVADTDYYLLDGNDGYSSGPYRKVLLHQQGVSAFGSGFRVTDIVGSWGYQDEKYVSTTTVASGLASDATVTTFTTSATPTIEVGHTLLIGTEQLYVTGLSSTTATVVRGVNGTTAAVHANASAISVYRYPRQVSDVALRLFVRRWKARDAGADGSDGGGAMPSVSPQEGEDTIIRRGLFGLRLKEMV